MAETGGARTLPSNLPASALLSPLTVAQRVVLLLSPPGDPRALSSVRPRLAVAAASLLDGPVAPASVARWKSAILAVDEEERPVDRVVSGLMGLHLLEAPVTLPLRPTPAPRPPSPRDSLLADLRRAAGDRAPDPRAAAPLLLLKATGELRGAGLALDARRLDDLPAWRALPHAPIQRAWLAHDALEGILRA